MMHSTGEPVLENGKVTRLIGNTLDITEQENALEEIRRLKDALYKENIAAPHFSGFFLDCRAQKR